ncbi:pyruvate dehydrogenase (acetyl-transferring) E1 component subunit alpha [Gordonia sp. zg691]|uniref:2-oxoisovalerate dehydrogenase subunit alpha n=1 Tax=Gordonia jinghuaiqii TaxID=2758710 RepID=A0A7D7LQA6_9ACTN|nr:thiamine pyrophosphate-dependent enzyme [Gordonia jinghuaiqii]MBD0860893.1 pyruvate dehydrogenase (acetyl-transferring) E1 component subunit alpha [Gordonia jinghuaiqii]MCR5979547.1 pyruvate dehydrogenase (acetyl-transferring) E1 component subunit alpha [Gordonia jinghuaiqii]QMT00660.1 pyruvate dehydrogenase (acetyl-transferring) E1 component subunit alpha [Gordonia jinghuaiqii]
MTVTVGVSATASGAGGRLVDGSSSMIQFLTPSGELTTAGAEHSVAPAVARGFYRDMALGRRLDTEALALQRQGELKLWLMSWGQEAAQVGSIRALSETDMVFPSYREHVAGLCRGLTPSQLLAQWRGNAHAGWDPAATRFHIYSLVLGAQVLHATGFAAAEVHRASSTGRGAEAGVVMAYFGDGASSQGDVNEAFNWAAAGRLPVLFFCQNNQWAISTPTSVQMAAPLHRRAEGFGMRAMHVDGNDVLAVHATTTLAAQHIRSGGGPVLVEATTYRRGGHSSSDDPGRYRTDAEQQLWEARDPLVRLRRHLELQGTESQFFDDVDAECAAFGASVRAECLALDEPDLDQVFRTAYAEPHTGVERERAWFAESQRPMGDRR